MAEENVPAVLDTKDLAVKIQTLADKGLAMVVTDDAGLLVADSYISDCLAMEKEINARFAGPVEKAHAAHKALTTWRSEELARVTPGKEHARKVKNEYEYDQKRKREAEEARLLKEAQDREEKERLDRAAAAEKASAALAATGHIEEAEIVQQEAEKILETPVYVAPPKLAPGPKLKNVARMIPDRDRMQFMVNDLNSGKLKVPPTVPGVSFRQVWEFTVHTPSLVPEAWRRPS